jgi:hypothetical protein
MKLERLLLLLFLLGGFLRAAGTMPREARVEVGSHSTGSFDPRHALGGGLDGYWDGETAVMYTPESVRRMKEAGLGPVSVRLRTELAVEAWHWNPKGTWSDPQHRQGYWISEKRPDPSRPILLSYGYKLPRRGTTTDEANDDGYSMLDDGDRSTFWKSNPYLTSAYTGEEESRHPQWVVLDFGKPVPINAVNIFWGEPYAKRFRIEYANSGRVYFGRHPWNVWHTFSHGVVTRGKGGEQFLQFAKKPVMVRYLRIWMTESSGIAPKGSKDPRDGMGYAIREIMAGGARTFDFDDHVAHSQNKKQTLCYVSSTDPWHREYDRDPKVEQPGIDRIFQSGITRGLPVMLPVPVFYDTPENGAALAGYVRKSRYPVGRWELGEEPDGQRIDPRDFGALYAQSARAIRAVAPDAVMGGPSFVTADVQPNDLAYRFDKRWWIRDFIGELKRRRQGGDLRFLSFEWYPFDDVFASPVLQLPKASAMMDRAMKRLRGFGLPLVIGEYNWSVWPCRQEVDLEGALLNAETAAQFLCGGGDAAYFYGYEPNNIEQTYGNWGNHLMLRKSAGSFVPVASFRALRLLTHRWMDHRGGRHNVIPLRIRGIRDRALLGAYCVKQPDGTRSLLLVNKDTIHPLRVWLKGFGEKSPVTTTYSAAEYSWQPDGRNGHSSRNLLPSTRRIPAEEPVSIPPWSLTVVSER